MIHTSKPCCTYHLPETSFRIQGWQSLNWVQAPPWRRFLVHRIHLHRRLEETSCWQTPCCYFWALRCHSSFCAWTERLLFFGGEGIQGGRWVQQPAPQTQWRPRQLWLSKSWLPHCRRSLSFPKGLNGKEENVRIANSIPSENKIIIHTSCHGEIASNPIETRRTVAVHFIRIHGIGNAGSTIHTVHVALVLLLKLRLSLFDMLRPNFCDRSQWYIFG